LKIPPILFLLLFLLWLASFAQVDNNIQVLVEFSLDEGNERNEKFSAILILARDTREHSWVLLLKTCFLARRTRP
jgi:hypothetical protein